MKNIYNKIKALITYHYRFFMPMAIILTSVTLVMLFGCVGFRSILRNNIDIMCNSQVNNIIYDLNRDLKDCAQAVKAIAEEIKITPSEQREGKLQVLSTSFSTIYGLDLKNVSLFYDNVEYSYIDTQYKVSQQPWFEDIFNESEQIRIFSQPLDGTNRIVVTYSCIDPKIVVVVTLNEERIYRDYDYSSTNDYNIYIVNSEDIVVSTNADNPADNTTDVITGASISNIIPNEKVYSHIKSTQAGNDSYKYNGVKYKYYYNSIYNEWYVILLVKESVLYSHLTKMNLWEAVLTVCILFIVTLLYYNSYSSNLKTETASKAQAAFFANMSHEIRTPLNAIIGMSEIILRRNISTEVRNDALAIHNSGTGLLTIINDILDLSKIESGKFEIVNDEYFFPALIAEVVNIISFRLENPDVDFIIEVNPDMPVKLIGDEVRFKQILMNIITNAVKFTKKGYIKISLDWNYIDNEETTLTIKVEDTGIGIKEDEIKHLFVEFQQADIVRNRTVGGTGLGLAISKNLAEQMGGTITVESEYGKGTIFTITVKNKVKNYIPIASVSQSRNFNVAIYETNPVIIQNLRFTMKKLDVLYVICKTPQELLNVQNATHLLFRTKWRKEIASVYRELNPKPHVIEVTDMSQGSQEFAVERKHIFLPLIGFQLADFLNEEFDNEYTVSTYDTRDIFTIPTAQVLIVDDNPTNTAVAKGLLEQYKMKIDTADNGEAAIEMVQKKKYDMIFMDNMMPGLSGIETTQRIRGLIGKQYERLPIIALTATISRTAKEEFLSKGFNGYLSKPMDLNKLDAILHKYLENKMIKLSNINPSEIPDKVKVEPDFPIDVNAGIQQLGGNKASYIEILRVFTKDLKNKRPELQKYINDGDWDLFTINVHAIKSSAANVRADKLSKIAKQMEQYGKDRDIISIKYNEKQLFNEITNVTIACDEFLKVEYTNNPSLQAKGAIPIELIANLKDSCKNLDMVTIEEISKQLNAYIYPDEIQYYVNMLNNGVLEFDYSIIAKAIRGLEK